MIKKGLTILIAALVLAIAFSGVAVAEDYEISTELSINGTGSFDRELEVQTELGFAGKSLDEDFYTRWMGTDGDSKLEYASTLEVYMGNSSEFKDTKITTIDYAQTKKSTLAEWVLCSSNYDMGASAGAISKGNMIGSVQVGMDDAVNEFELEGSVYGRLRLMQKAVDPVSKEIYLSEDTKLEGRYDVNWYSYIEKISYPEGEEDWLGCP
jgi:hypothetical protein